MKGLGYNPLSETLAEQAVPPARTSFLETGEAYVFPRGWEMQTHFFSSGLLTDGVRARLRACRLTPREEQIVELLLHGMSNKVIAQVSNITEQTVKDHLKHVYRKMGVHQRTAVIAKLLQLSPGILSQPSTRDAATKKSAGAQRVRRRVNEALEVGWRR